MCALRRTTLLLGRLLRECSAPRHVLRCHVHTKRSALKLKGLPQIVKANEVYKSTSELSPQRSTVRPSQRRTTTQLSMGEAFVGVKEDPFSSLITTFPLLFRDACGCPMCVDPASTQKTFQTTDIPTDIKVSSVRVTKNGTEITWENDVPGFQDHVSFYPLNFPSVNLLYKTQKKARSDYDLFDFENTFKDEYSLGGRLQYATFRHFLEDDSVLELALSELLRNGIFIIRDVPESETAVEDLAGRLGPIRETFYGRTWDVKSVPKATNVAYTDKHLGLHMDLLYMTDPPGFQFLHCLKNSCEGGESLFVDSFAAARQLSKEHFEVLSNETLAYQYKNAGQFYYHEHPVIEVGRFGLKDNLKAAPILAVNYSPPFQAPLSCDISSMVFFMPVISALRQFALEIENPERVLEYKLQPGECVIFNNRRMLHGRKHFDTTGGERWLKGAYVDTDVFRSRYRVLQAARLDNHPLPEPKFVCPEQAAEVNSLIEWADERRTTTKATVESEEQQMNLKLKMVAAKVVNHELLRTNEGEDAENANETTQGKT